MTNNLRIYFPVALTHNYIRIVEYILSVREKSFVSNVFVNEASMRSDVDNFAPGIIFKIRLIAKLNFEIVFESVNKVGVTIGNIFA